MEHLAQFLNLYTHLTPPDAIIRRTVGEAIEARCGVLIPHKHIRIIRTTAYIEADSVLKSAIFLKKLDLLADIKGRLGKHEVLLDIQ